MRPKVQVRFEGDTPCPLGQQFLLYSMVNVIRLYASCAGQTE